MLLWCVQPNAIARRCIRLAGGIDDEEFLKGPLALNPERSARR
jgi:hypothetical protein